MVLVGRRALGPEVWQAELNLGGDQERTMEVVTSAEAAAVRPGIEDPTFLANGMSHPKYIDWLCASGEEREPWLNITFELLSKRLPQTEDTRVDSTAIRAALGPRWLDIILGRHLGARASTWTKLARLIGLTDDEMTEHVERARAAKAAKETMLRSCRRMPFRLQTWDQVVALQPCPGCGHPWGEPESEQAEDEYRTEHGECRAGGTAFAGRRRHCNRCCGYPPMNPEIRKRVAEILASSARARAAQEEATQARERLDRDVPARVARREAEIAALERRLEGLRRKQQDDEHQLERHP